MALTNGSARFLLIGGVGGSGTRIVARIVNELGIYIGNNLNGACDNLDWPGNTKLLCDRSKSDKEKLLGLAMGFEGFTEKMLRDAEASGQAGSFWATKVPGSFYYLPYLAQLFNHLHYIHVVRHGLDMAFSNNQNQLFNWGSFFDLAPTDDALPKFLLKYWAKANTYALAQCHTWLPERHISIRLEDLCSDKENSVLRIMDFVGKGDQVGRLGRLTDLIKTPETIRRYQRLGRPDMFDRADIETVRTFGYEAEW